MRGVLLLGWIACWTVVCNCQDGRMDSGNFEATTDMDDYLSHLLKEDFVFLSGKARENAEDSDGCKELNCDPAISDCIPEEGTNELKCKCKESKKLYFNHKCEATCKDNKECSKKQCRTFGEGDDKICQCPKGKSGDDCEEIDDCETGKYKDCKDDKGTCGYNDQKETAVCTCEGGKVLDSTVGFCKASCSKDDDCKNEGSCGENKMCSCKNGTSGELCEIIRGCDELKCTANISECVFNEEEEKGECQCTDKSKVYFNDKCVACTRDGDCKNGGTCSDDKVCSCKKGTSGDQCQTIAGCDELKCNAAVSRCQFNETAEKGMCQCYDKKKQYVNNTCEACDCGDGICSFKDGQKHCVCEKTFVFKKSTEKCEKCDCGKGEEECYFDNENNKNCRCHEGYKPFKDTQCVECNCGENGDCDLNEKGQKVCRCHDGFAVKTKNKNTTCVETCESDDDCENSGKCKDKNSVKFCECVSGTTGDKCESITECVTGTYRLCEESGGECTLKDSIVECACEPKKLDQTLKMCREKCGENKDCSNEAECKDNLCQCKKGTSGDDCSTIDNCKQLNCEGINAECIYNKTIGNGTCKCNDGNFLYVNNKCVEKCKTKEDCTHGAACEAELCRCLPGTSGDKCEKNDGCAELNCEDIKGKCVYDIKEKKATCECTDKEYVYKDKKCIAKWCLENCKNDVSICSYLKGTGVCLCKDIKKYYDYATDTCKVAKKEEKKCTNDCGPLGWCFKKDKDTEECRCDPKFAVAVKGKCELNAKSICATKLLLEDDPYKCKCNGTFKYAQNGITCEKRTCSDEYALNDCKSRGASCEDVWKVKEVGYKCTCPEGYVMDNGKCLDACSRFSVKESCSANGQVCYTGEKGSGVCTCSPTFVFNKVKKICEASSTNITFMLHNLPVVSKKYLKKDDVVSINIVSLSQDIINAMKKVYEKLDIAAVFNYKKSLVAAIA
ncbi:tenascin-X [Trichonephila inaurata madagascariensis]|uniref:Tenascin-X n=1 Tax=Trichonephila inaurata madagascariensis TaxID=2747483 RepID=A0A8X7BWT4_9ARAC|nr:tenascin-X [Trichonephila inaurata madagascariensis]